MLVSGTRWSPRSRVAKHQIEVCRFSISIPFTFLFHFFFIFVFVLLFGCFDSFDFRLLRLAALQWRDTHAEEVRQLTETKDIEQTRLFVQFQV
jgi:hypothetical protein